MDTAALGLSWLLRVRAEGAAGCPELRHVPVLGTTRWPGLGARLAWPSGLNAAPGSWEHKGLSHLSRGQIWKQWTRLLFTPLRAFPHLKNDGKVHRT